MHEFYIQNKESARNILPNRQVWFDTENLGMGYHEFSETKKHIGHSYTLENTQWMPSNSSLRAKTDINELIFSESDRNAKIAKLYEADNIVELELYIKENRSVKEQINALFAFSNMDIVFDVVGLQNIIAKKGSYSEYSISRMSDGEKNALLIAANILTAPKNTLFIIDEPERHLHKSIVVPFLSELFSLRKDCSFVISTHEIELPNEVGASKIILLKNVIHHMEPSGKKSYEYDIIENYSEVPEEYKLNRPDVGWYQIRNALKRRNENPDNPKTDFKPYEAAYKTLGDKLRPLVYEYGFLKL